MPLPKIDLPLFEIKLASVPRVIQFRPFLVKEEKLLLMALQSEDEQTILKSIKQVVNNCLVENTLDIDSIPIFDIEYLFLNIRARSVGEIVDSAFVCKNVVGVDKDEQGEDMEVQCGNVMNVKVNILEIQPPTNNINTKLYFTKDVGIQLKFPSLGTFQSVKGLLMGEDLEQLYQFIFECTDYVFDENSVYYAKESSLQEFSQFLDSLTQEQFDKIIDFFKSLPTLKKDIKQICEKCNFEHDLTLEGLSDFFT
jgi:hypothetical protein